MSLDYVNRPGLHQARGGWARASRGLLLVTALCGCNIVENFYDEYVGESASYEVTPSAPPPVATTVYSYVNEAGRTVYVDQPDRIPAKYRAKSSTVGLSQVSLNTELARDLDRQVLKEHRALARTPFCAEHKVRANHSWWRQLFHSHGYILLIAASLVVLILVTPFAIRSMDPPAWTRLMAFAIPSLIVMGLVTHSMVEASRVRQQVAHTANLCDPERIASAEPDAANSRIKVVQQLRAMMHASEQRRKSVLDDVFRDSRIQRPSPEGG
jgi:hypothetical protein